MNEPLCSATHRILQMSRIFCNHLPSSVCPSFAKHSSSSLVCLLSASLLYNRSDINHPLPHLRWNRRGREDVPAVERKGVIEDEKNVERDVLVGAFMPHFTALNYHNSCVKAGMENRAGQSWGQLSLQYSISTLYAYSPINYTSHST